MIQQKSRAQYHNREAFEILERQIVDLYLKCHNRRLFNIAPSISKFLSLQKADIVVNNVPRSKTNWDLCHSIQGFGKIKYY